MGRISWMVVSALTLAVIITGSVLYANNVPSVDEMFVDIDHQVKEAPDRIIAQGPDFEIYSKDFALFKANLAFSEKMNNVTIDMTDKDIIHEMIKEALVVNLAREEGLFVSKQEITDYITHLRELLDDPEHDPAMKQIRDNLVKCRDYQRMDTGKVKN